MSEQTDSTVTPETFDVADFSAVKDGSRVADENRPAFAAAIDGLFRSTVEAATYEVGTSEAVKAMAQFMVDARMVIITEKQIPDLGATSDAYRLKANATFTRAFDTVTGIDEQGINRVKANARKAVGRGPLLRATLRWIVKNESGYGQWDEAVSDAESLAKLAADPPAKLRKRVNELYDASKGLTAPYAPKKGDGMTAPPAGPTSALTNLKRGGKAVGEGKIVPSDASEQLLVIVKGMAVQFLTKKIAEVENLPTVRENVDSAFAILALLGPAYHGEASGDDIDKLIELVGLNEPDDDTTDDDDDNGETADAEALKLAEAEKNDKTTA